jgi:hydrogenase expression/formation protein HypC
VCVAVPARVLSIGEPAGLSIPARVAVAGTERAVDLALLPDARVGDYVVIHSGYGISVVPQDQALRTIALLTAGLNT